MALGAVIAVALAGLAVQRRSNDNGASASVAHATALTSRDANFATAIETGVTFTRVSTALQSAGEQCLRTNARSTARCDPYFAGAAYARVSATSVLTCTRPGVFDARAAMQRFLANLATFATRRAPGETEPAPPAIIRCR